MRFDSQLLESMLNQAGVTINGPHPWDLHIHDDRFLARLMREKSLGLGESYMDGWWDCERVDQLIYRLLRIDIEELVAGKFARLFRMLPRSLLNRQSKKRAMEVADQHYNLGNDLFFSFLDPYKQYSCAYFKETDQLEQAQLNKMALIANKLHLSAQDRLLDIGCGWGGLARYTAEQFGCRVTGINISSEQLKEARASCADLPVQFREVDYRTLNEPFDKIVSVGMFEHVGWKNYRTFFEVAHRCLTKEGRFLLHNIGRNTSVRGIADPWVSKYVFPNSMLPSLAQIAKAVEGLFVIEDVQNIGPHYDPTLMAWNQRFQQAWPTLEARYDQRFKRMWEYYLLSCAGAFRSRSIQLWQTVMTRA